MLPKISIIVPNYNGSATIKLCIESLLSLNYPKEKLEIIIVDNNSTDNSRTIISSYPVKLLLEKDTQSSYAARNKGVKEARGDVIALTDVDCIVDKDWLINSIKYLSEEDIGGIAGEILNFKPNTLVEEYQVYSNAVSQRRAYQHPYLPFAQTANAIYKRIVFEKIGEFEPHWISGGDVDFSWRMQIDAKMKLIYAKNCIVYHIHRMTSKGLYFQSKRCTHGAFLLNEKFHDKFAKFNTQRWILYSKIFKNQMQAWLFFLLYLLIRNKKIFFLYLSKIERLGSLKGCLEFLNKK